MSKRQKSWYKPKGYLHISPKLKKDQRGYVQDYILKNLEQHNFFPLIHETISARRYKMYLDTSNVKYRSHWNLTDKKPSTKPREIFYANHLDAHIYSYFSSEILGKNYENILAKDPILSDAIIAYRKIPIDKSNPEKGKCNIHFADEVFEEIQRRKNCVVVCYDIENFFPSLSHTYLETCWEDLVGEELYSKIHAKTLRSLTHYSYVEMRDIINSCVDEDLDISHKNDYINSDLSSYFVSAKDFRERIAKTNLIRIHKPKKKGDLLSGIPQGTPISAFLANLYLLEFDKFIVEHLVKSSENCFYRRYSDDIVVIFENMDQFSYWDKKIIEKITSKPLALKINPSKTVVSQFITDSSGIKCITKTELCTDYSERHALKYLGFEFKGKETYIKPASISKFYRDMKTALRRKARRAKKAKRYNLKHPKRKAKDTSLHLSKLYSRFTHLGKNKAKSNYLTYVDRAAKEIYPDLDGRENPIKGQVSRAWSIFMKTANRYKNQIQ